MNGQKIKLIIDTDPGFDDAMSIGVAMRWPNVELLAITCVNGNVPCWQTSLNALKIRQLFERKDVPVFKGAESPLFSEPFALLLLLSNPYSCIKRYFFIVLQVSPLQCVHVNMILLNIVS